MRRHVTLAQDASTLNQHRYDQGWRPVQAIPEALPVWDYIVRDPSGTLLFYNTTTGAVGPEATSTKNYWDARIAAAFQQSYGRGPTAAELKAWEQQVIWHVYGGIGGGWTEVMLAEAIAASAPASAPPPPPPPPAPPPSAPGPPAWSIVQWIPEAKPVWDSIAADASGAQYFYNSATGSVGPPAQATEAHWRGLLTGYAQKYLGRMPSEDEIRAWEIEVIHKVYGGSWSERDVEQAFANSPEAIRHRMVQTPPPPAPSSPTAPVAPPPSVAPAPTVPGIIASPPSTAGAAPSWTDMFTEHPYLALGIGGGMLLLLMSSGRR